MQHSEIAISTNAIPIAVSQDGHMSFDLNPEWIQTSRSLRGTFDLFVKSR